MIVWRHLLPVLSVCLMTTACGDEEAQQSGAPPALGNLVMERLDGGADAVSDFRGKVVVLNVWATWCGPCRREMPGLQALADKLDPNRYAVLGLSIDENPALVREYLNRKGLAFARHIDRGGARAHGAIDVSAVPKTLVIAPDGRVLWDAVGERDWSDPQVATWLEGLR